MGDLDKLLRRTSAHIEENPIELQTNNFMRARVLWKLNLDRTLKFNIKY